MAPQIKPSVTNPTIADVYQDIQSEKLILAPDFQRKFVWTSAHQEEFIDTILQGYPFPEIYVCQGSIDVEKLKTTQHVIDGQQRLTTIKNYIEGRNNYPFLRIPQFAELDVPVREAFLTYQMVIRDLGKIDDATVREVFRRINLTKFQLDDVEIHNAVYNGEFITTAKTILEQVSLEKYGVFHESEFTRMADLHFVLLVMSTLENRGYFPQDNEVEHYIAQFNNEYPNKEEMEAVLLSTFRLIESLNLPFDSIWLRKSNFFTLVVELARHFGAIPGDLEERLYQFETLILENRGSTGSEYADYYSYMYTGTNSRKARVTRSDIFADNIFARDSDASPPPTPPSPDS